MKCWAQLVARPPLSEPHAAPAYPVSWEQYCTGTWGALFPDEVHMLRRYRESVDALLTVAREVTQSLRKRTQSNGVPCCGCPALHNQEGVLGA